jgi:hypothetical protein
MNPTSHVNGLRRFSCWPTECGPRTKGHAQMHDTKLCEVLAEIAPKGRAPAVVREELARKGIRASYYEHRDLGRYGDDAELRKDY